MSEHKYGRGKFDAHVNYVAYMRKIVEHENYRDMPNAQSSDGRIYWQVSSGKTTSFYKDYLARVNWWVSKADQYNVAGKGCENERRTVAARIIHPDGFKPCRLCGENFNIGYFYANANLTKKLEKKFPKLDLALRQPIDDILSQLKFISQEDFIEDYIRNLFPERQFYFDKYGVSVEAFMESNHIRSKWLTPGYMGNPDSRLDGLHDYHFDCREEHDPGRAQLNMRSYTHDRRSFEWWAEGNWMVADALYNSAGPGVCGVPTCGEILEKVSPDHVGPLACGFKQLPFFMPMCGPCNSSKQRRFTLRDVKNLIGHEKQIGTSVASWQVRAHWDLFKNVVEDDGQTKALSNSLRSLQDMYLRVLWKLYEKGQARFLTTLLHPEYALIDVEFEGLNSATLSYDSISLKKKITTGRKSLAARTVRIAFESLRDYVQKPVEQRKLVRRDFDSNAVAVEAAIAKISLLKNPGDDAWVHALSNNLSAQEREALISELLILHKVPEHQSDAKAREILQGLFDQIGNAAAIDFTRYSQAPEDDE